MNILNLTLVLCGYLTIGISDQKWVSVLQFPGHPKNYAYLADGFPNKKESYTQATVCTWAKFSNDNEGTLIYQPQSGKRYGIVIVIKPGHKIMSSLGHNLVLYSGNKNATAVNRWFHVCVSWCNETRSEIYLNGKLVTFRHNGALSFGAAVDPSDVVLLGIQNFRNEYLLSFNGSLYQTNIWGRLVSPKEICQMIHCQDFSAGDALSWSEIEKANLSPRVHFISDRLPCIGNSYSVEERSSLCANEPDVPYIPCDSESLNNYMPNICFQ